MSFAEVSERLSCLHHKIQGSRDIRFQVLARNDRIEHAVFEQELRALEAFWQPLPDCLFDDSWSGKTNQRSRFGQRNVALQSETRRH